MYVRVTIFLILTTSQGTYFHLQLLPPFVWCYTCVCQLLRFVHIFSEPCVPKVQCFEIRTAFVRTGLFAYWMVSNVMLTDFPPNFLIMVPLYGICFRVSWMSENSRLIIIVYTTKLHLHPNHTYTHLYCSRTCRFAHKYTVLCCNKLAATIN